jgi:hypothetical protein
LFIGRLSLDTLRGRAFHECLPAPNVRPPTAARSVPWGRSADTILEIECRGHTGTSIL